MLYKIKASKMKIIVSSFQGIHNGVPSGAAKILVVLISNLKALWNDDVIMYVGYKKNSSMFNNVRSLGILYQYLIKALSIINIRILKKKSFFNRYLSEQLYDLFLSFRLSQPVVLISSAYLYRSIKKNKKNGGINIFISGNPDDREINNILKEESLKFKIAISDAYTYEKRLNFISKSIDTFDHIICFSTLTYNTFLKYREKKYISIVTHNIIPNPTVFKNINIEKKEELVFCYLAHPFWLKGLTYLLIAWSKINHELNIGLKIGGNISDEMKYYISIHFPDLRNLSFTGWVDDINVFFRSSDVAIVPSILDAGPTTIAEAMHCGLPVIASNGCGSSQLIINGENGFIIPARNEYALQEKIEWFIDNNDKILLMSNNATNTIKDLCLSNQDRSVAEHIIGIINSWNQ